MLLILRYDLLVVLTEAVGAVIPTSTLFFLCILDLGLLSLNYSVRLSELTRQVRELAQEMALLRADAAARALPDRGPGDDEPRT